MKKQNTVIALGTLIFIPLLMLFQQWAAGRMEKSSPPAGKKWDFRLMASSEEGLEYHPAKAHHTARTAGIWFSRGEFKKAEKWMKLGAAEYRYPSLMLLYGSFLIQQKRLTEARRWITLACHSAEKAGEKRFAAHARRLLTTIPQKGRLP